MRIMFRNSVFDFTFNQRSLEVTERLKRWRIDPTDDYGNH
jgi:hypothetical protein